jgi:prepilin-type N-terminal cleavage/methylation domain-containing protein
MKIIKRSSALPKPSGFTLFELLTVIFMIALVSAFAVPGIISWRSAAKLRGAAENLKGDLEFAKLKAIQENGPVAIVFRADGYQIFLDTGATAGILDADEPLLKNILLPAGVKIDFAESTFAAVDDAWPRKTRFMGRGTADPGKAVLINSERTKAKSLTVSGLGKITLANFPLD